MPSVAVAGGLGVNTCGAVIDCQIESDSTVAAGGVGGRIGQGAG